MSGLRGLPVASGPRQPSERIGVIYRADAAVTWESRRTAAQTRNGTHRTAIWELQIAPKNWEWPVSDSQFPQRSTWERIFFPGSRRASGPYPQGLSWGYAETGRDSGPARKLGPEISSGTAEIGRDSGPDFSNIGLTEATTGRRRDQRSEK